MSRKTTGAPGTRRRVLVGTAVLSTVALIGGGLAANAGANDPTITKVTDGLTGAAAVGPLSGGKSVVKVEGTNLDKVTSIWFGGVKATRYTLESPTLAYVTPPAVEDADDKDTYDVDVTVQTAGSSRTVATTDDYSYTAGPVVETVKSVEKTVEITGTQLLGATAVLFGDVLVKVDVKKAPATATKLTVKAPALKGGAYDVTVVSPLGLGTKTSAWGALPVVSKLVLASEFGQKTAKPVARASAASGTVAVVASATGTATSTVSATGTVLMLQGTGFSNLQTVKFGKAPANFSIVSDTLARVIVPAMSSDDTFDAKTGVTAAVLVTATNGTGSSAKGLKFTYDAVPVIDTISDTVGLSTSTTNTVTIKGKHLDKAKVKIGTVSPKVVTSTSTELVLTVGKGTADASGDIVLTTAAGTVKAPVKYTWKATDSTSPYPTD